MSVAHEPEPSITAPVAVPRDTHAARVRWLDGVRGAAATFVVMHHIWLSIWPQYPRNTGPWWVGFLLYGHLAVAVFIVVSGFSLALAPMRRGGTLSGGARRFLGRRAWRILPPYWAALIISTLVGALWLAPSLGGSAWTRAFVVYGALLQDLTHSIAPNSAFWSIAVEWQIYFLFPLILLIGRLTNFWTAVGVTIAAVVLAHGLAGFGSSLGRINHLTPQFLALFAVGVLAARLGGRDNDQSMRRMLLAAAVALLGGFVVLTLVAGSVWVVGQYFWVDIGFGLGVAAVLAVMYNGGARGLQRVLGSRLGLKLGLFSYSIYLLHAPILGVMEVYLVSPLHLGPVSEFGVMMAIGLPVTLAVCYGFHLCFEAPFLYRRDLTALREIPFVRAYLKLRAGDPRGAPREPAPELVSGNAPAVGPEAA